MTIQASRQIPKHFFPLIFTLLFFLCGTVLLTTAFADQGTASSLALLPTRILPIQGSAQSSGELSKGKFLVASRQLLDANFSETVVLLTEYSPEGAMGVVINRPTEVQLAELLPEVKELQQRTELVYLGGPVARTRMFLLVRTPEKPEGAYPVFADVYVSASRAVLKQMAKNSGAKATFRAYAGYAGWAPGQLEQEVARGDWYIVPADAGTIFDKAAETIWPELVRRGAVEWTKRQQPNLDGVTHAVFQGALY